MWKTLVNAVVRYRAVGCRALRGWWLGALMGWFCASALAAPGSYRVYFDTDANSATGCAAPLVDRYGAVSQPGFEHLLTVLVDGSGQASPPTLSHCVNGAFAADAPSGDGAPNVVIVPGRAITLGQLELSVPIGALGSFGAQTRLAASVDGADYIADDSDIQAMPPTPEASGAHAIPAIGPVGVLALMALLAALGWSSRQALTRRSPGATLAVALLLAGIGAGGWAAVTLAIDASTADWQGVAPVRVDLIGDQVPGRADLHSLSAVRQGDRLFLRIDTLEGAGNLSQPSPLMTQADTPHFDTVPKLNAWVGQLWRHDVRGAAADGTPLAAQLVQAPAGMQLGGVAPDQQLRWTPGAPGKYLVMLKLTDAAGRSTSHSFLLEVADDRALPPDPATRATPLPETGFAPFAETTAFLYQGSDPIQAGVAPDAIEPIRAAVIRGRVLGKDNLPLPGVTVKISGHPEFGHTRSRADGWFDLAVNGGGLLTLAFDKPGYLPAQRKVPVPWRDWAVADDVVLITRDRQSAQIASGASGPQLYWGAEQNDGRGARRTSIYFPPGVQASMRLPGGVSQPLSQLTVRASEYTTGANGPESMPGELPRTVGYTWAADFSVDQAEAAGAERVEFSQPVIVYVDNFIGAPVGTAVPAGWYDFTRNAWVGADNGRVIRVRAIASGQAVLQVTTEDRNATVAELQALGITDVELQTLARLHQPDTVLWRTPVAHFTPWDFNWPYGPPDDADPPAKPFELPAKEKPCPTNMCCGVGNGCDVHFGERALGQGVHLPGTPFGLYYKSNRVDESKRWISMATTTPTAAAPAKVMRAKSALSVAGVRFEEWHARAVLQPGHTQSFEWDGRDAYGRMTRGQAPAQASVSYFYPVVRYASMAAVDQAFDQIRSKTDGQVFSGRDAGSSQISLRSDSNYLISSPATGPEVTAAKAGGWALTGLPLYDAEKEVAYADVGKEVESRKQPRAFAPMASMPSSRQSVWMPGSFVAPDGSVYISHPTLNLVQRVWLYGPRKGEQVTVAGTGTAGFSSDGGLATAAELNRPGAMALAPDGSLFVMEHGNRRLRRIEPDGVISTVAGNGQTDSGAAMAGLMAHQQPFEATSLAALEDMSIISIAASGGSVRRIAPSGVVSRVPLTGARALAQSPRGIVWIATDTAIHQMDRAGGLRQLATDMAPSDLMPNGEDGLYYVSAGVLKHVNLAGQVTAMDNRFKEAMYSGGGGAAFSKPVGVAPDGRIIIAREGAAGPATIVLGEFGAGFPAFGDQSYVISRAGSPALADSFDAYGRPISTNSTFGGHTVLEYEHNANGFLTAVTDVHGKRATFERDAQNRLTAVVGFFGERTTLAYDAAGSLASVVQPGGITHRMEYSAVNPGARLLTAYHTPRGNVDRFNYDEAGNLLTTQDPDGGSWSLLASKPPAAANQTISRIDARTAEGRLTRTEKLTDHTVAPPTEELRTTASDGTQSTQRLQSLGRLDRTEATGVRASTYLRPDGRVPGAATRETLTTLAPDALSLVQTMRYASFNPARPLAPSTATQWTLLNNTDSWVNTPTPHPINLAPEAPRVVSPSPGSTRRARSARCSRPPACKPCSNTTRLDW